MTDRRTFCLTACQALSLASLGAGLSSCSSPSEPSSTSVTQLTTVNGTLSGSAVQVNVAAGSALATTGSAALVQSSSGSFLVTRISESACSAVTAVCTHEGCTVNGIDNQVFVCPCHGSRFSSGGSVVKGPASNPLRQFSTQVSGDVLTISL